MKTMNMTNTADDMSPAVFIHNQAGTRKFPAGWGIKTEHCEHGYKLITDKGGYELACYRDKKTCCKILKKCNRRIRSKQDYVMPRDISC